jgi:hypothetical protein
MKIAVVGAEKAATQIHGAAAELARAPIITPGASGRLKQGPGGSLADTAQTQFRDGMSGEIVGGRYHLVRRIAAGGMADVYAADDIVDGRPAAIKILPHTRDPESISRFQREAEAAVDLAHPHIVRTYDWGAHDGTHYIAMEYIPGPTLKQLIDEHGALPEDRALELAAQLADALGFAHRRHVIHRDVKPHNVLLDSEGNAKLADFGIALVAGSIQLTRTRSVLGTAQYLSPEQARGSDLDERTDLYSLGVVLFEMLTGRVPFQGDSPLTVALKHTDEAPPRPRDLNPGISPHAEAVVLKALAKDPASRYQSAAEMGEALLGARVDDAVSTAITTRIEPTAAGPGSVAGIVSGAAGGALSMPGVVDPAGASATPLTSGWRRQSRGTRVWLVAAAIAVVGIALMVGMSRAGALGVIVPDVRGMTEEEAQAALDDLGIDLEVAGELVSADVPAGRVISQQPSAGDRIGRGGALRVAVSMGRTVSVPDLMGRTEGEARALLAQASLTTGVVYRASSDSVRADRVTQQAPAGGQSAPDGSEVDMVVSSGRAIGPAASAPVVLQPRQQPPKPPKRGRGRD